MTNVNKWSTTPATNATADGNLWSEGQTAPSVNNGVRDAYAAVARYRDDTGGALTTGGTTTAYTVTTITTGNTDTETLRAGFRITLKINAANTTTTPTLAIDGGTAKAIQKRGAQALAVGDLEANAYYDLVYNGAVWEVVGSLSAGIASLVADTTPQLGGDLDANGNQIKWAKGADVASATALPVLTDGNYFDVTGTTTVTSINTCGGDGTIAPVIKLHFDGALVLTHHATNLILPGGASITTAAGDEAEFVEYGAGTWRCTNFSWVGGTPVLGGANTWPGIQTFANISNILSNTSGVTLGFQRPTIHGDNQSVGALDFAGQDDGGTAHSYGNIFVYVTQDQNTAEAADIIFMTSVAGTLSNRFRIGAGLFSESATGGDKGADTINAGAVYDDNVLLTCYPFDQALDGAISDAKWDALVADTPVPEVRNAAGEIITPATTKPRSHGDMRKFKARIGTAFDPLDIDKYAAHWKQKRHLTSMPSEVGFDIEKNMPTGAWIQRLIETVEIQAIHIETLNQRLKSVEAR